MEPLARVTTEPVAVSAPFAARAARSHRRVAVAASVRWLTASSHPPGVQPPNCPHVLSDAAKRKAKRDGGLRSSRLPEGGLARDVRRTAWASHQGPVPTYRVVRLIAFKRRR